MKKILISTIAIALMVSFAAAQTDVVYSVNVVGFQKENAKNSALTMAGMPFFASDAEINSVIGTQLTAAKNEGGADRIYLWDSSTQSYKKYFLNSQVDGGKWVSYTDKSTATTDTFINVNMGFWIDTAAVVTQEVVLVGDVVNDPVVTNYVYAGLNLLSYPFSSEININSMSLNDDGTAAKNEGGADRMYIWDSASQSYQKFFLNSQVGGGKWVSYLDKATEATNIVDPQRGFWYDSIAAFNWIAERPYTID